jgi:hypothetical protein
LAVQVKELLKYQSNLFDSIFPNQYKFALSKN